MARPPRDNGPGKDGPRKPTAPRGPRKPFATGDRPERTERPGRDGVARRDRGALVGRNERGAPSRENERNARGGDGSARGGDSNARSGDRFGTAPGRPDRAAATSDRQPREADRRNSGKPAFGKPATDKSAHGKPAYGKPAYGKPAFGKSGAKPAFPRRAEDGPARDRPIRERTTSDRPTGDRPAGARPPRPERAPYPGARPAPRATVPAAPIAPVEAPPRALMPERDPDAPGERIAKLLARAGIASRREVERMIAEGRVKLGDDVLTTPATILKNLRGITVDGEPVRAAEAARLFAFHKPDGLITAERDPAGRPTIYAALRNALPPGTPRVMPVGRLDFSTEGLLLMTNDGELKRAMELPSSGVPRKYRARTFGEISQGQLETLIEGVTIDGINYGRIDANLERRTGRNQWVEMTMTEGKNREVRRVLEYLGLQVSRLMRISYGPFDLGDLPRGAAYEIRPADLERFRGTLKTVKPKAEKP